VSRQESFVPHDNAHRRVGLPRPGHEPPPLASRPHGFHAVEDGVEQHLPELHAVAATAWARFLTTC